MQLTLSLRDGALGYVASQAQGLAMIGVSSLGDINKLIAITNPKDAYTIFGTGKLPDRIAVHLSNGGPSPVYAMRGAGNTAGSIPAYAVNLHAAHAASAANTFPALVAAALTWLGNNPRNVEMLMSGAGWDGGAVTVNGTDVNGNAIVETFTQATLTAGVGPFKGNRVFKTITSIVKTAIAGAVTCAPQTGNKSAEGATTTDAQLALSGTPLDDYEPIIQLTRAGDVAAGTPAFKASFDNGETYTAETAIPAGGVYSGFALTHGLTLTFVGAACKVGDAFRQSTIGPAMDSTALSNALTALAADPAVWEGLHILGALTGAQGATVETWHGTCRAAGRFAWTICESRDFTAAESQSATPHATWQTSVKADWAAVTSTFGQLSRADGYIETVIPAKGVYRRNGAWLAVTQISRVPISEHPGQPVSSGPLRGAYKPADGPGLYQDERINPGMGGSIGRGLTLQTLLGRPGQFFVGDAAGLRSPGTLASGSSDYSLHMMVRLAMKACRLMQEVGTNYLARRLRCKTNGTLLESQAKILDGEISGYLKTYLTDAGDCVSARAVVSRSQNVLSTKILPVDVYLLPFGYALEVQISIGFEKVIV